MKVLVVSHLFPNDLNQAHGVWLYRLLRACRAQGVDVRVINPDHVPGRVTDPRVWLAPVAEALGIYRTRNAVHDDIPSSHPSHSPHIFLPGFAKHLPRRIATELAFFRMGKEFTPDLVHCVTSYHSGTSALPLARRLGVPLVVTEISSPYSLDTHPSFRRARAEKTLRYASKVACTSAFMKQEVLREFPFTRDKLEVVYFPVEDELFTHPIQPRATDPLRLLTTCFLNEQKGLWVMLDALRMLKSRGVACHWTLVGDGPLRRRLEDRTRALGLEAEVHFTGLVPPRNLGDYLRRADAYVMASLHETQGLALIEAMAAGLPSVYTLCGGPEEYMNETLGIGVPPGSADALAEGIEALARRLEEFDREHIRNVCADTFGSAACAARMLETWRAALPSPSARRTE